MSTFLILGVLQKTAFCVYCINMVFGACKGILAHPQVSIFSKGGFSAIGTRTKKCVYTVGTQIHRTPKTEVTLCAQIHYGTDHPYNVSGKLQQTVLQTL